MPLQRVGKLRIGGQIVDLVRVVCQIVQFFGHTSRRPHEGLDVVQLAFLLQLSANLDIVSPRLDTAAA